MSDSNRKTDKYAYRDAYGYRARQSTKEEKEYRLRPTENIRLRSAIGLRGPMMEKWRAELIVETNQSRQSIKPRGTMKGRILIPLRTVEKDQLTLLIGLVGPMKGKILHNAFKSSWEYCLSFSWLT